MNRFPAELQAAIDAMEPLFRKAFLDAVQDIRSASQLAAIADALAKGNVQLAAQLVHVEAPFWAPLDEAIYGAYLRGGRDALVALPVIPDPAGPGKS